MHFLTFDTSLDKTYLTLFDNEKSVDTKIIETHDDKYHSAFLIQNIVNLLKANSLSMQDIKAIGVNIGPGSFTGIRACLTIARVAAQQLEVPLVGVSSLEILAQLNTTASDAVVVMDARKSMCYYAKFNTKGIELIAPKLCILDELNDKELNNSYVISDKTMQNYFEEKGIKSICYTDLNEDLGQILGELTFKKLSINPTSHHWATVKPLYLQKPSITVSKKSLV